MKKVFLSTFIWAFTFTLIGQNKFNFTQVNSIPIIENGVTLPNAWAGGINYGLVNTIDLNGDAQEDLVIFDRNTSQLSPFLRVGSTFEFAPQYIGLFPIAGTWMLLRDYNCDGKKDIFFNGTQGIGFSGKNDVQVWKNTGIPSPMFTDATKGSLQSIPFSSIHPSNLFVLKLDLPGIADIDNDGDLDIVTMTSSGTQLEFHENQANCGLDFFLSEICWGHFSEDGSSRATSLNSCLPKKKGTQHLENTVALLPIDLNSDSILDLLLGNVSYTSMKALYNTGNWDSTHFTYQDSVYPKVGKPIDLYHFPMATYEDVTFDGIPDLLLAPAVVIERSPTKKSLQLYTNNGTASTPSFTYTQNDFMQNTMMDLGMGAVPRLVDLNGDSLMDLVIANIELFVSDTSGRHFYYYYINTGTKHAPAFTLQDTNFINIASHPGLEESSIPAFGDLDNDGDQDMIVGGLDGRLHYFQNSSIISPNCSFQTTLPSLDVGDNAAPFLFDMDGDGDLDMLVGNKEGAISYFTNSSSIYPTFILDNDNLGGIDVKFPGTGGYSVPYVFRKDGKVNLFVGSEDLGIIQYDSVEKVMNMPNQIQSIIGNGTIVPGGSDQTPFGLIKKSGRNQFLYRGSELQAQGLVEGIINSIAFDVTTANNGILYGDLSVSIKMTSDTTLNSFSTGLENVFHSIVNPMAQGWTTLNFTKKFIYDGHSNLIIEVCYDGASIVNNNVRVNMTDMGYYCNAFGLYEDPDIGCNQKLKGIVKRRPNTLFIQKPTFAHTGTFSAGQRSAPALYDLDRDSIIDMISGTQGGGLYHFIGKPYGISIPEEPLLNTTKNRLDVFPNPGKGSYTLLNTNEGRSILIVLDLTGRVILKKEIIEKEVEVDLKAQPAGVYIFKVQTSSSLKIQKVIQQ